MPERAVAYCDRVYEEGAQQPSKSNIYFNLLQIYLNQGKLKRNLNRKLFQWHHSTLESTSLALLSSKGAAQVKRSWRLKGLMRYALAPVGQIVAEATVMEMMQMMEAL